MGLDISAYKKINHKEERVAHIFGISYGGFNAFREFVAKAACGYSKDNVTLQCIPDDLDMGNWTKSRPLSKYTNLEILGRYKGLIHLLAHADNEGTISRRQTRELWFAVSALHADIIKGVRPPGDNLAWVERLGDLMAGTMLAVQHDAYLVFH